MPGTIDERIAFARAVLDHLVMPDTIPIWADGTEATVEELERHVLPLVIYEAHWRYEQGRRRKRDPAQKKALLLLHRFLSPEQKGELRRRRFFTVETPSGRIYRFDPTRGRCDEVTRHGSRLFAYLHPCIHPEDAMDLPPADVTLAQWLLLSADEEEFRATANWTNRRAQLWNGEWRRTLNRARQARERGEETETHNDGEPGEPIDWEMILGETCRPREFAAMLEERDGDADGGRSAGPGDDDPLLSWVPDRRDAPNGYAGADPAEPVLQEYDAGVP